MGLRDRSIRLRVGILIAVPIVCLAVLYGLTASLTLGNALTQARASSLRTQVGDPVTVFQLEVAAERHLAVLSLATPTNPQIAGELSIQETATSNALANLRADLSSAAVTANASREELAATRALLSQGAELSLVRSAVATDAIEMRTALIDYDSIIQTGYVVLDRLIDAEANVQQATQAIDLVNLDRARLTALAEGDLLAGDMARRAYSDADRVTIASLAATRQELVASSLPDLQVGYRAAVNKYLTARAGSALTTAEAVAADTPWHSGGAPAQVVNASSAFATYPAALERGLLAAAAQLQQAAQRQGDAVLLQLILAGGLGLVALIASVMLAIVLGHRLVRQLRDLRASALTLAHHELPSIVDRLRSGQAVDLAEYAPAEISSDNEVEQVRHAFRVVRHAAVRSAIDESRLRRGISDVFRNLAGRSQSLLHRQLTLLDSMERRATEPDELEDLFRIDHLTTRMRRHAEGLIILSGDTPARGWRQPVPLVDVLRAAVAEVEDYTRIRVVCRTTGSVAGHAVADIIHLLAELAENATVFSPPTTPVRMQGDDVGQGFAIEIEDRGLGISPARLEEINANLASPPQFDLSDSDRLGLFITSRLAERHDLKVTLRQSVYGGTTAIVLIPAALVADDVLVESDPALPAGTADRLRFDRIGGRHAALAAIPAGHGPDASQANGHLGPSADADQDRTGGSFVLDGVISVGADASDGRDDPDPAGLLPTRIAEDPGSENGADADVRVAADRAELGLPVRIRQASLAPQLRNAPPGGTAGTRPASGGFTPRPEGPAAGGALASPEAARDMVNAFQRGWQLGRAAPAPELTEPTLDDVGDETGHRDGY